MKCKFLRDYHGQETDEHRYHEGEVVILSDAVAKNFEGRRIVVILDEPKAEPVIEPEPVIEEVCEVEAEIVKPNKVVKRHKK